MMALVLVVLSVALWRGSQRGALLAARQAEAAHDPVKANAAVYRDQLAELEREHQLGNLNDDELQASRDELAQRLLDDVRDVPAEVERHEEKTRESALSYRVRRDAAVVVGT